VGTSVSPCNGGAGDDKDVLHTAAAELLKGLARASLRQGLTLVHLSAQLKRFLWDRGCI